MHRFFLIVALITQAAPTVDIPLAARQTNWIGEDNTGSCVHASMVSLLRWQGRPNTANRWMATYGGGENPDRLKQRFDREGVRFAQTLEGDETFLAWAIRTRRGCGVTVHEGTHMVDLIDLTDEEAVLLDNNNVGRLIRMPRDEFLAEWHASHGWAVAPVYTPAAPSPVYE
jgi:hypothetical protein